jgi:hypothetical protein
MMAPTLGDVFIDVQRGAGVGFNATSLRNLRVDGRNISFDLQAVPEMQRATVRFAGTESSRAYKISCNHQAPVTVSGESLAKSGYVVELNAKTAAIATVP